MARCTDERHGGAARDADRGCDEARRFVVGMILTASAVAGAKEPVSIRVSPAVSMAPAALVIRTSMEPHAEEPLDGSRRGLTRILSREHDRARRRWRTQDDDARMSQFPAGEYEVTATVTGVDDNPGRLHTRRST
jgi:hypothetical protein